jgi:hypothetical protein
MDIRYPESKIAGRTEYLILKADTFGDEKLLHRLITCFQEGEMIVESQDRVLTWRSEQVPETD